MQGMLTQVLTVRQPEQAYARAQQHEWCRRAFAAVTMADHDHLPLPPPSPIPTPV